MRHLGLLTFFLGVLAAMLSTAGLPAQERPAQELAEGITALQRGDAAWERRAEGLADGYAAAAAITEAIEAYEEAVAGAPSDLEAHWKLMRAIYFKGEFVVRGKDEKQKIFARAVEVFQAAVVLVEAQAAEDDLEEARPVDLAKALRGVDHGLEVFFWGAVNWGLWGDNFGALAAVRQGVAGRLRDYSQAVVELDPSYDDAGPLRLLGRLHALAPKVPFFTGWIDRDQAIEHLEEAMRLVPEHPYNRLFLAEALLEFRPRRKQEGLGMLRALIAAPVPSGREVEKARAEELARQLLQAHGS